MLFWLLTISQIILLAIGFFLVLRLFYIITSFHRGMVPYVPTPGSVIKKMVQLAKINDAKNPKKVIDLGSGSGKIVFRVAKMTPDKVRVYGIEQSRLLYTLSLTRWFFHPQKHRIVFIHANWNTLSLESFDVVFAFLTTKALKHLFLKFKRELQSGTAIISYLFALPKSKEFIETSTKNIFGKIFVYSRA